MASSAARTAKSDLELPASPLFAGTPGPERAGHGQVDRGQDQNGAGQPPPVFLVEELLQQQHEEAERQHQHAELGRAQSPGLAHPGQRQGEVDGVEERAEESGREEPLALVELDVPGDEVDGGRDQGGRRQDAETAQQGQREQAGAEQGEVAEEDDLGVRAGAEQRRRQEAAGEGQGRQPLRVAPYRQADDRPGDQSEERERRRLRHEGVEVPRRVAREIDDAGAERRHPLGEVTHLPCGEPLAVAGERQAAHEPDQDAPRRPDPLVLEGVAQEEGGRDQEREDADPVQPAAADQRLEVDVAPGGAPGFAGRLGGRDGLRVRLDRSRRGLGRFRAGRRRSLLIFRLASEGGDLLLQLANSRLERLHALIERLRHALVTLR